MTTMEGPLSKWTNVVNGWQYRWFVLDDNAGLLSYYTSKEKMMRGARRGCVRLKGAVIGIDDEDDSTFTITVDQKIFHFQARDADERERWIRALEDTILRHAQPSRMQKWDSRPSPSLEDLNKKLTETDIYLQMLIDQVKKIEQKIEKVEDNTLKDKSNEVKNSANMMLESVKHSIVSLQIAKNTAHPINGIFQPNLDSASNDTSAQLEDLDEKVTNIPASNLNISKNSATVQCQHSFDNSQAANSLSQTLCNLSQSSGDDLVSRSMVVTKQLGSPTLSSQIPQHLMLVPAVSYSSSEDDESFYDANDYEGSPTHQSRTMSLSPSSIQDVAEGIMSCRKDSETKQVMAHVDPSRLDYDAIYEDDDEDELESLEQHGSVITHLLSQVKLGMDLTKVVLPTFILERRSLLEMYADFFAHPDLFCSIVDFEDPKDRMIQVVKWYLSAFHAGRKSTVAKKPYNPILGEIFRCYYKWDSPDLIQDQNTELVHDGPIPWATRNELAFIAEQVSHHPPISAFYAEHYNKRISLDAHIWTKSKFLGLSIGVHMIGQGCISVLDYEEEYIISFPNGYGRSILTVPWVELGGKVNITCAKTGYYANIEFQTKPFYGGKKHRVLADIFSPNEKKSFVNVTGEWNGIMVAKYDNGVSDVFVDTRNTPIIKKIVRLVGQQEEFESRRLWKDVTLHLKMKAEDKATAVKHSLEQLQREEAKERAEKKIKWDTRYFHEVGEHWIFDRPLLKRYSASASDLNVKDI